MPPCRSNELSGGEQRASSIQDWLKPQVADNLNAAGDDRAKPHQGDWRFLTKLAFTLWQSKPALANDFGIERLREKARAGASRS